MFTLVENGTLEVAIGKTTTTTTATTTVQQQQQQQQQNNAILEFGVYILVCDIPTLGG